MNPVYLKALELTPWQHTQPFAHEIAPWQELKRAVASCTQCALHASRTQTVFGEGNMRASLMIVGEAPGYHEDKQGEPFVGRAGLLLNAMLQAIGLSREDVFIANILKCRPPQNRNPDSEEIAACTPFLEQQIKWIQPKLIVALGRVAAHHLLGVTDSLSSLRKTRQTHEATETPLKVTYHPAYLLRNPKDKAKAWEDLKDIRALCAH